ncbi:hypothetical protein LINPERHAP1_LOCUS12917 [Linum perenne]
MNDRTGLEPTLPPNSHLSWKSEVRSRLLEEWRDLLCCC